MTDATSETAAAAAAHATDAAADPGTGPEADPEDDPGAAPGTGAGGDAAASRTRYTADTLLEVAVSVFNERGYDGTSMEHLSRAAGISKSSIYHHVRSKEELLRRAVGRALDGLFAALDEADAGAAAGEPAVRRLERVLRGMTAVLLAETPYVTLLLRVRGNTGTERYALDRRREFDQRIARLVADAAAEGDLSGAVEPRLAGRLVAGMVNSLVEWYRPGRRDPEEIADAVVHVALAGLR